MTEYDQTLPPVIRPVIRLGGVTKEAVDTQNWKAIKKRVYAAGFAEEAKAHIEEHKAAGRIGKTSAWAEIWEKFEDRVLEFEADEDQRLRETFTTYDSMRWAFENHSNRKVKPDDAPTNGAATCLTHARDDIDKFLAKWLRMDGLKQEKAGETKIRLWTDGQKGIIEGQLLKLQQAAVADA